METAYRITTARPEHIHRLAAIERAAATICPAADLPAELRDEVVPVTLHDEAQQAGRLWVVEAIEEGPVGYALCNSSTVCPILLRWTYIRSMPGRDWGLVSSKQSSNGQFDTTMRQSR